MSAGCFYKKWNPVHLKKYSKIHIHSGGLFCYILVPMKISESIEAHQSTAVAAISQRNQATLPGHLIFNFPIFKIFNRLAKASGFCLYFYTKRLYNHIVMPNLIGHLPFIQTKEIPALVAMRTKQQVVKCCPPAFAGMTIRRIFI